MNHKPNFISKFTIPFLMAASFTMLVGCGSSDNSTQAVKNGPNKPASSTTDTKSTTQDQKDNKSASDSSKSTDSNKQASDSGKNNSGATSSNSDSNNNGNNGLVDKAPTGKTLAFETVKDLSTLPSQAQGMVDTHKADKGTFRDDENGYTYILIASGKSPSDGLTLRAEKVTDTPDAVVVTTSEYKPGSTGPVVPYVVVKIKQTSKPTQAYNLGYTK